MSTTLQRPVRAPEPAPRTPPGPRRAPRTMSGELLKALTTWVPLGLLCAVMIAPLVWMVLSSLKTRGEILHLPVVWLPAEPNLDNYRTACERVPFFRFFLNSVVITAAGSAIKVVLAVTTAYALVFVRFPFKRVIFLLVLVALMVPPHVSLLPNYALIAGMGGQNTYWGIVLPGLGTAFGTFLLRQHFLSLPVSLLEAAELDGAGHGLRLLRIVAPISAPTIATVALVSVVTEWNEYLWPLIIVDKPEMMTLPVGLMLLQNTEPGSVAWGVVMAGAVVVVAPILVVFALLQRHLVAGLTQGAVTG